MLSESIVRSSSSASVASFASCSGSENITSKPTTFAPSRDSASMSAAMRARGHGQRPSASRLFSSIAAITTAGPGLIGPRARKRRSSQFSSIASNIAGENANSATTIAIVPAVIVAGLSSQRLTPPIYCAAGGGSNAQDTCCEITLQMYWKPCLEEVACLELLRGEQFATTCDAVSPSASVTR